MFRRSPSSAANSRRPIRVRPRLPRPERTAPGVGAGAPARVGVAEESPPPRAVWPRVQPRERPAALRPLCSTIGGCRRDCCFYGGEGGRRSFHPPTWLAVLAPLLRGERLAPSRTP